MTEEHITDAFFKLTTNSAAFSVPVRPRTSIEYLVLDLIIWFSDNRNAEGASGP